MTDLSATQAHGAWYAVRVWIEASYRDLKRDGWHWEQTNMPKPRRAERLWLAMRVAMRWSIRVGTQAEAQQPATDRAALPPQHIAHRQDHGQDTPRRLSHFRRGRLTLVVTMCLGLPLPTGQVHPEPWPETLDTTTAAAFALPAHQNAAA